MAIILGAATILGLVAFMVIAGLGNIVGSGQAYLDKAAVSTLWSMHWAQGLFRENAFADRDGDGVGEFGTLGQLGATAALPAGGTVPASLLSLEGSPRFDPDGLRMESAGTCFVAYLPEDADGRERRFVIYAWPARPTGAGQKAFCIDQDEDILETANEQGYLGCDRPPPPGACRGPEDEVGAPPVDGPKGDGFVWTRWKGKTSRKSLGAR